MPADAVARKYGPVGLIHFDAHPDTWDEYFDIDCVDPAFAPGTSTPEVGGWTATRP